MVKEMPEVKLSRSEKFLRNIIQHYNEEKYWRYRENVINGGGIVCQLKLLYIKRCDAFNNATFGTHIGFGATFLEKPNLPHGLCGIVISHNAVIGRNATIFHQVTIGEGKDGAPVIGDNVLIGAGAKIIGKIRIGNNVKIGAGCVVCENIPDFSTVVMEKPRIINKNQKTDVV